MYQVSIRTGPVLSTAQTDLTNPANSSATIPGRRQRGKKGVGKQSRNTSHSLTKIEWFYWLHIISAILVYIINFKN